MHSHVILGLAQASSLDLKILGKNTSKKLNLAINI